MLHKIVHRVAWHVYSVSCKLFRAVKMLLAQLCRTLCDTVDCSLPGSSVQGVLQARIPEWVAISFSRGSS